MTKLKLLLLVSVVIMLFASACTKYTGPTGNAVNEAELEENAKMDLPDSSVDAEETGETEKEAEDAAGAEENEDTEVKEAAEELGKIGEELGEAPEEGIKEETATEEGTGAEPSEFEDTKSDVMIEGDADVIAFEGDLIDLKSFVMKRVMDPDGDAITLEFTKPFENEGVWQTGDGDAGFYSVVVTATDKKDDYFVSNTMSVRVLVKNKPPQIGIPDSLEFNEGELIVLDPKVSDEDGDNVTVTYSGWMGKSYQTTFEDAGTYKVKITANDGVVMVSKEIDVTVKEVNRKPQLVLSSEPRLVINEGELVEIKADATDPDGDDTEIKFSEPLDEDGRWQTEAGNEGKYEVEISATDGKEETVQEILIEVLKKNAAPLIESVSAQPIQVVLKKPGDKVTVKITVVAKDSDGDELEYAFSGDMTEAERTFEYGEKGGLKTVKVTVSDGKGGEATEEVTFDVNNWPCFDCRA